MIDAIMLQCSPGSEGLISESGRLRLFKRHSSENESFVIGILIEPLC